MILIKIKDIVSELRIKWKSFTSRNAGDHLGDVIIAFVAWLLAILSSTSSHAVVLVPFSLASSKSASLSISKST